MRIVVDTNILVSFFRSNPVSEIVSNVRDFNLQLFAPELAFDELKKNKQDILKYSGLNEKQFNEKLTKLAKFIRIIPKKQLNIHNSETKKLIHEKDAPFFALALKLNCPIWSNEPAFKKQSVVKIFSTRDMLELLL